MKSGTNLRTILFLLIVVFSGTSCGNHTSASYQKRYVLQAFDSIRAYSLHKDSYNFDSLKTTVLDNISGTSSHEEVLKEINQAIKAIDRHSYMITAGKFRQMQQGQNPDVLKKPYPFLGKIIHQKYGYIALSSFMGGDSIAANNYADSLQSLIQNLYNKRPEGWIIDLRNHSGGWTYAMLAGLGPILGKGIKAYKMAGEKILEKCYYMKTPTDYILLADSAYVLPRQLPAAILINSGTASAAELLALAFRGNPKTILIGTPSYGVSTSLKSFVMPDSTRIFVTNSVMTDREKNGNGGKIHPDILASDSINIFNEAYHWIDDHQSIKQRTNQRNPGL